MVLYAMVGGGLSEGFDAYSAPEYIQIMCKWDIFLSFPTSVQFVFPSA